MRRSIFLSVLIFILLAAVWSLRPLASAKVFGLEVGTPLSQISIVDRLPSSRSFMNYVINLPNANQRFFHYYEAFITPKNGLCSIKASSEGPHVDQHQTYNRTDFNQLEEMLAKQYGSPEMVAGSGNPNTIWSNYNNDQRLMGGIRSIGATLMDDGTISVIYHFRNLNECIKEIRFGDL
ncbi:MAG TPA: hypothetical protein VGP48_12400 [Stellaceae bacterium]|nr:hypothetical protein [Stellaceae bacterium]